MTETPKRLSPTSEVIRRLFLLSGNQCAFPGCQHPIISHDGIYVGEICHIRAAEAGGERFDSNQSNEERRAFENLMLLCHDHHVVTDDVGQYSVERMIEIKRQHEARFERGIADLESSEGIQITNSHVFLGGTGGAAPGAGGGGGGAIGHGARAGDGGLGGRILDIGELGIEELLASMPGKPPPGAGGGGAGAIGPDAEGGTGGGGGDYIQSRIDGALLQRLGISKINVRVGAGGEQGRYGQPSGYDLVDDRGNIIISVNAPGGRGGGDTPQQPSQPVRALSVSTNRTYVMAAFLANAVELHNGLFTVLSGGWSAYTCNILPAEYTWPFVIHMSLGGVRPGDSINIQVILIAPDGKETNLQSFDISRDNVLSSPTWIGCIPLCANITEAGLWTICIRTLEAELSRIPIEVRFIAHESSAE